MGYYSPSIFLQVNIQFSGHYVESPCFQRSGLVGSRGCTGLGVLQTAREPEPCSRLVELALMYRPCQVHLRRQPDTLFALCPKAHQCCRLRLRWHPVPSCQFLRDLWAAEGRITRVDHLGFYALDVASVTSKYESSTSDLVFGIEGPWSRVGFRV